MSRKCDCVAYWERPRKGLCCSQHVFTERRPLTACTQNGTPSHQVKEIQSKPHPHTHFLLFSHPFTTSLQDEGDPTNSGTQTYPKR